MANAAGSLYDQRLHVHGSKSAGEMAVSYKGCWNILKRTYRTSSDRGLWVAAAGVAFFAFYTLIPTLAVLIVTYGILGGGDDVHARMRELGDVFPDEAMQALFGQMMDTAKDTGSGFGWGLFGSLMVLVWSGLFGMRALMAALNHAYHEVETRGFFKLNGMALLLCFGSFVLAAGLIGILTAGPFLLRTPPRTRSGRRSSSLAAGRSSARSSSRRSRSATGWGRAIPLPAGAGSAGAPSSPPRCGS